MKIGVPKEEKVFENRVAISPEVCQKLSNFGFEIVIEMNAGTQAGMLDEAYEKAGARIEKDVKNVYRGAETLLCVNLPAKKYIGLMQKNTLLVGMLNPLENKNAILDMAKKKITAFALEWIPRLSRAQGMDVLSSQSNLAGYKAVVDAAAKFGRAMPMMMTAAGMIPPARVLIVGAGVAGLQAIATARRLGAIVSAFDVRQAAREQVQSLGATFIEVESGETGEGNGGYAREMSDDYKKRQQARLEEVMSQQDIIITTAQVPGKVAPVLISEKMVMNCKPGAIIVDLAIDSGGNCAGTEWGKIVVKHGVKIIGYANYPSRIAYDASRLYARNSHNFLKFLLNEQGNELAIDWEDDIVKGACLCRDGDIIHPLLNVHNNSREA